MNANTVFFLAAVSVTAVVTVVAFVNVTARRCRAAVALTVALPRGLEQKAIELFVASLSGLRNPWWRRLWAPTVIVVELVARGVDVSLGLIVPEGVADSVTAALRSYIPAVRISSGAPAVLPMMGAAAEYRITSRDRVLRVAGTLYLTQLHDGLRDIDAGTVVVYQWVLTPTGPMPSPGHPQSSMWDRLRGVPASVPPAATVAARKEKWASPVFEAVLRIGVASDHGVRAARGRLRRVESALHTANGLGVHLRRRPLPARVAARRLRTRSYPTREWPIRVNASELSGLLGWPHSGVDAAGVAHDGCRPLPVSPAIPTIGTVLGEGVTGGSIRPVAVDQDSRFRHMVMVGGTGSGKTSEASNMAVSDAVAGWSVMLIDPKFDLKNGFLASLPEEHHHRVVVLDPSDMNPVGFDPIDRRSGNVELAVEHFTSVLHRIYSANWGPRLDDCLRAGLRTLVLDPDATLAELPAIFTNPTVRHRFLDRVTDPTLVEFWAWFSSLSDSEAATVVAPLLSRLRALLGRQGLRRTFCQPNARFDLGAHLDHGGIVVVGLNAGVLGEDATSIFASVIVGHLWNVIQRRALQPPSERHPTMVFLDEIHRLVSLPVPLEEMLAQARSYRVGIVAAAQHLGQLSPEVRRTMLSTPRSRVVFQLHGEDAAVFSKMFGLGLTPDDLSGLGAFEVAAQLHAAGRTQPAATFTTLPPPRHLQDPQVVQDLSRQRWGADGAQVDELIRARLASPSSDNAPKGRRRRRQ